MATRYNVPMTVDAEQDYDIEFNVSMDGGISATVAEAWAVGKRGGVDVSSSDPTYNNHAKYYAQQAAADRESSSGSSQAAAASAAQAAQSMADIQAAAVRAETAAQEAADTVVAAQGDGICYIDPSGHMYIFEDEEEDA